MRMLFSGFPLVVKLRTKELDQLNYMSFFVPIMKYAISLPNTNRLRYLYASKTLR